MKKRLLSLLLALIMLCTMLPIVPIQVEAATELSAPPNPKVEYGFTETVICGTMRYISQLSPHPSYRNSQYFNWSYWPQSSFGSYASPRSECGTACISMALSYVGVNKTPIEILGSDGITKWDQWSPAKWSGKYSDIANAIENAYANYIGGNGKYSPLVVHLDIGESYDGDKDQGHFIIIAGRVNDNVWKVIDPATDEVKDYTISGNQLTYMGVKNTINQVHQWYNPNASICNHNYNNVGYCSKCKTEYNWQATFTSDDAGLYEVTKSGGIYLRTDKPYDASTAKSELIKEGTQVQVLGSVNNAFGNKWYKVSYNGTVGYAYHSHLTEVAHTCDEEGGYLFVEAAHPHKDCYKCSICGKAWAKSGTSNFFENCTQCQKPGKPVLEISGTTFTEDEAVIFRWADTINTTHYNLYIEHKNSSGNWERYEQPFYVSSGMTKTFPANDYRCYIQSYNSNCWADDGSDWLYTEGDFVYFTVDKSTSTPTGVVDHVSGGTLSVKVSGWAYDKDDLSRSVLIHVYVDSTFVGAGVANVYRPDVNSNSSHLGVGEYHGYYFTCSVPETLVGSHTVHIYAIDEETEYNPALSGLGIPVEITYCSHSYTSKVTTAATCTTKGVRTYTCSNCGDSYTETIPATGIHTWDEGSITTQPICTAEGIKIYTCTSCGTTKQETVKATGHSLKEYTEQATCTQGGSYGYVCVNCDYAEEVGTIPATGHNYGDWKTITAAGCTTIGIQEKTCTSCGDVLVQSIAATGHSYGEWVTTTAAGCTTTGIQEKTCSSCKDVQTQTLAATGHSYGGWVTTTAAGCTTTGTQKKTCASCGDVQTKTFAATGHNYVSGCCTSCGAKDPNTATVSGICGDNVKWTLDSDGVLTISGTGAMYDWGHFTGANVGNYPWKDVKSLIKNVIIEPGVTTIGNSAFYYCSNLISVEIPDSVTTIGEDTFYECANLVNVKIGNGVTTIDDWAFYNCPSLTSITLPDSVTDVGKYTFRGCSSLVSINIPSSVTTIGEAIFYDCTSLTNVDIGDGVTTIDSWAFYKCSSLAGITLPESVTSIGYSAFEYCSSLTGVTIPDSVTTIDSSAFRCCSSLIDITIPYSVTSIGGYTFQGCHSLTNITIPNSVTFIGGYAFASCPNLTSITIPDSVIGIDDAAFRSCTSLTNITIPNSVTSIGNYAFYNCSSLDSINIPDSVTSIGNYAFEECSSLTGVYITDLLAWCNISFSSSYSNPLCYADNLYLDDTLVTKLTIPDNITSIGRYAFQGCHSLASITIPDSVTTIGEQAFSGCTSLTDVYYAGSESQWKTINIDAYNNPLLNATIHYNQNGGVAGDVTGDTLVANDDVVYLLWHTLFPEYNPLTVDADFTGDGKVDNEDVVHLLWHCLFPEENPL